MWHVHRCLGHVHRSLGTRVVDHLLSWWSNDLHPKLSTNILSFSANKKLIKMQIACVVLTPCSGLLYRSKMQLSLPQMMHLSPHTPGQM